MKLNFSTNITASDIESRTLTGLIVPFGKPGNTSLGPVVFKEGSIADIAPNDLKLFMEHDMTRPVGRAIAIDATPIGLVAKFKIAETTAGNDVLIEARENLRDGFSIGANIEAHNVEQGVMVVNAATLIECSVVTNPAFKDARITDVAATESPDAEPLEEKDTPQVDNVESTNVEVEEVEASAPVVEAAAPKSAPIYTAPRVAPLTASSLIENTLKAHFGNESAREYLRAANNTAGNTGLVPTPVMNEILSTSNATRGAIDAISRGALPASGMSFEIPKITNPYPTVDVIDEGDTITASGLEVGKITVDVVGFKGRATGITWEVIERSSPAYMNELVAEMGKALAKEQDTYVLAALVAGGTAGGTQDADAEGFQDFLADESSAVYSATGQFANNVIANPAWWSQVKKFRDTTGRSLYNAMNPSNNAGNVGNTLRGDVDGFNFYVDPNFAVTTTADNSLLLVNSNAATWYEGGVTQLRVNNLADGTVEIALYSPGALAIKHAAGIRKWNLT